MVKNKEVCGGKLVAVIMVVLCLGQQIRILNYLVKSAMITLVLPVCWIGLGVLLLVVSLPGDGTAATGYGIGCYLFYSDFQ